MARYEHIGNKRPKEHGLLIAVRKSMNAYCKRVGIEPVEFAYKIGLASFASLENKLKRTREDTDITVSELIHIAEITKNYSPLKYLNEMFGFVMTSSESAERVSIEQLNELTDEAQMEQNDSFSATKRATKDGQITSAEKDEMLKEAMEAMLALKRQIGAVRQIVPIDTDEDEE